MDPITRKIPDSIKSLLTMYYNEGDVKNASNIRSIMYANYENAAVDSIVSNTYYWAKRMLNSLDAEGVSYNHTLIMNTLIRDLAEYGDNSDWALEIVADALESEATRKSALYYIETDVKNIGQKFIPNLQKIINDIANTNMEFDSCICFPAACYNHMKLTLAMLNDIHHLHNHVFDIDPAVISRIKEILFDDDVCGIRSVLRRKYNGATANHVVASVLDEYITANNTAGVSNIIIQGLQDIEYFNDEIFDVPIRALKYALNLHKIPEAVELVETCFDSINDLLMSLNDHGDNTDARYCDKLITDLISMQNKILQYIEQNVWNACLDTIHDVKSSLINGDCDEDDDD